ncbi:AAA domain-containing protein [Draconibacterium orientale]|uniref:AAA domain-containing protein n=1 Tax=Draconibacterium orientale TaxID=1168034 RepID=UPI002A0A5F88|nr:AAA domain-containing protein [Draconibacterium orientale]
MKIKNIREYRTFYKNEIRDLSNRDEHFMGTFYQNHESKKKYGWFEIYHGDKEGYGEAEEGIGNFLSSFLDMAKDGQAVYEFLQNAVDAGASHFTMAWGKDEVDGNNYVLIANNGEMFNFNSIRSILNVGSSTKTADSQNIGKFGIGFKLAHRLVGKENGLEELLSEDPSGPILFSWNNKELGQLATGSHPEPQKIDFQESGNGNYHIADNNPWLFKILITCFPALPGNGTLSEDIRLSNGKKAVSQVFHQSEYQALSRWVKKYRDYLNDEQYKRGALFFIKLGAGKENDLADHNLAEGVRFSLAILQETAEEHVRLKHTLQTVQLNREAPIKKPTLNYLFFHITKSNHLKDYIYIRFGVDRKDQLTRDQKAKLARESDIEVLFGFRDYDKMGDYFKGAPNFYLYFPLSEEVHNFNFVLHSNAFYKASSRTFLHKGTVGEDGINERLLRTIARRIEDELKDLYESGEPGDKEKFLHLYAALLTSKESQNFERQWVKEPFIKEITKVLNKLIPVRHSESAEFHLSATSPRIKTTAIDLPSTAFGLNKISWFYWGADAPDIIRHSAVEKLRPMVFDVFTLLLNENISVHVNIWIKEKRERIGTILNELNIFDSEKIKSEHVKQNLKKIRFFEFSDGQLFNDNDLVENQDSGYIVLHNKLKSVEPELKKIGLKTSLINLDDYEFYRHYNSYLSPDSQLRSQAKVIQIISSGNIEALNTKEKLKVFRVLRDMIEEGRRGERLGELKLFRNQSGKLVKIKNILRNSDRFWLKPFLLHEEEQDVDIDRYLLRDESKIYEHIVYHFWDKIASMIAMVQPEKRDVIFNHIKKLYQLSEFSRDEERQLTDKDGLFFKGGYEESTNAYYNNKLLKIGAQNYPRVQTLIEEKLDIQIPDYEYISIYNEAPFSLNTSIEPVVEPEYSFSSEEAGYFLIFCKVCGIDIFEQYSVIKENQAFKFIENGYRNYHTENNRVVGFIDKYFDESLILLPAELTHHASMVPLREASLVQYLIQNFDEDNYEQVVDLANALIRENEDALLLLFKKLNLLSIDLNWEEEHKNSTIIKLVKRLFSSDNIEIKEIQDKILLTGGDNDIRLSSIDSANDDVLISYKNQNIRLSRALILGLEDDGAIRKVLKFAKETIDRQLLTEKEANNLFKIESANVTEELIQKFDEKLDYGKLLNTHQLVLVLLGIDEKYVSNYKVLDATNAWQEFEGNWIMPGTPNEEYYDKNYVLADTYRNLNDFLKLPDKDIFPYGEHQSTAEQTSNDYIIPSFMFRKGLYTKVLNSKIENLQLIKFLHGRWHLTPSEVRTSLENESWSDVLGFEPGLKVYSKFIQEEEKLDQPIVDWVNKDKDNRAQLLNAIGVKTDQSDISVLRTWFYDLSNDSVPVSISKISSNFLSNTLVGLAEGFYAQFNSSFEFHLNSKKYQVIIDIINELFNADNNSLEIRLPVWNPLRKLRLGDESGEWPKYLDEEDYTLLITNSTNDVYETLVAEHQIIVRDDEYIEFAEENYEQLVINYSFIIPDESFEHDEPFYKSWNKKYNIKLVRVPEMEFEAMIEDEELSLGFVPYKNYHLVEEEGIKNLYYRSDLPLETLQDLLSQHDEDELVERIQELIDERDKMLKAFYNTLKSSGRDEFDDEDTKQLLKSLNERSNDEKRNEIIEVIKSNQRYSYDWFESYISYLLSFEELEDTTTQKSISFQSIEPYKIQGEESKKYFILKGANSVIPMNIEAFEDFSINITFRGGLKENITVEGVSKKGQDLLTFIPQGINEKLKSNFKQAVRVKINFSPVLDLIQRLYDAFTNDDILETWEDIQEALQPVHFIYGPPGTGKTTKLCSILEDSYSENPYYKALVLVPTNKAGDVLAKKLIQNNTQLSIIRVGSATDPELEAIDSEIYQVSVDDDIFDASNVIISTIHRFPYYQISKTHGAHYKLYSQNINWDMVIFDESSMISLPYIVFALLSLKDNCPETKYYVAGDPKQIPPIVDTSDKNLENLDMEDESIYKMLKISSFNEEEQALIKRDEDIIENLSTQYRSLEPIGNLFSKFSYEGLLNHGRDMTKFPKKQLPDGFIEDLKEAVSLISFPLDIETSVLKPRKLLYSSYHVYAGILASELIKFLDKSNVNNKRYTIGIISPYKAQALLMNKLIKASGISDDIQVLCDTVHGFQGDECDIIIFVVNPNNMYYTGHKNSLLSKEYVYNVAISRSRDYLWILNPFNDISNNPHLLSMKSIIGSGVTVLSHRYIEDKLFSDPDFIVQNSYLTGHDNINVFGQVDMKYFIKAGSSAIDIQLRK